MTIIKLNTAECSDVIDILQQRGVEFAYTIESGVAFLYGSEDMIDQVQDILWARHFYEYISECYSSRPGKHKGSAIPV